MRQSIDPNQALSPGDKVELHFRSTGMTWIKATQIALIENRLEGRADFVIRSVRTPADQPTVLIFEVDIKQQAAGGIARTIAPIVITCAAIAGLIAAGGIVYKLTLEKSFLLVGETVSSPAGKVGMAGAGIGLAAAGVVALLALLPKR